MALSLVLSPVELIKCRCVVVAQYMLLPLAWCTHGRLQLGAFDKQFHRHKGPLDVLRNLMATEGPRGLLRGMGATMAREVPGNALYFVTYHGLRRKVDGVVERSECAGFGRWLYEASAAVACGGAAGVAMWCVL